MDRQYMPYWPSGPGQYPPVKEEPDYSKMGYEDTPGGGAFGIKSEPNTGHEAPPPPRGGYAADVKVEPPVIKQELVEPKQEPAEEERRGEKRQASNEYGPPDSKRYRPEMTEGHTDDDPVWDKEAVILDWYNSDLSLTINTENFLSAEPMTSDGFAYVWHGVRATYGFLRGRLCFEVKIEDDLPVPHLEEEQHPHVIRVGWSIDEAGLTLGEEPFSYGYGGTGKASTDLKFKDYGRPFGKGDVVGCFLDMDSEPIIMSFSVNGRGLGKCYEVSHHSLQGKAMFPHILTKNCSFKVNYGSEYPWFQPLPRYNFVGQVPLQERVLGMQGPQTRQESEVIMMVGLPACGKTTWVEKYCKENVDKKFYVLGTNFLIDKMKVNGLSRKRNYHGRWDVLIEKCTKCLNKLLGMSYKRKRNFIIDQTNVYPSARRRKMKGFPGFYRRAVVVCPSDAELQLRTTKQISKEGKNVPDSAIMEMKANFTLPEVDEEIFDAVEFVELPQEEATKLVEQYSKDAQSAGFVKKPPYRGGRFQATGDRGGRGGGGNFRGGWNRDRNSNNNRGGYSNDQSSESNRGGFGRDNRGGFGRGGFERGGYGSRGGFERGGYDRGGDSRGGGGFDRGGESSRGGYDRRGDGGRGGFGRGGDSNRGGFGRGGDSRGGFGRGSFSNRDGGSRGFNMDRDNQGYGQDSNNSYQGFKRDNDRDTSRGYDGGDRNMGNKRDDDTSRGRYGQDNFSRNRDSQSRFDTDRNNRGGGEGYSARGFGQNSFGGNRDADRGSRDFSRGSDSSRGSGGYGSTRDVDKSFSHDNSGGNDTGSSFSRDSQRGMDRDYGRGAGGGNFGGFGSSNRSYSTDRERDSRSDSDSLGGYSRDSYGGSARGFGSHDNLSRNMGNQGGVVGGGVAAAGGSGGYGSQDLGESSGYSSLSSSSGSLPTGQNYGNGWNRQYNQQPPQQPPQQPQQPPQQQQQQQQYWGQNDAGYGNQTASGPSQQSYARPFDRSSSPGGGASSWGQQSGSGNYGGSGGGNQSWNYGSSGYQGQRQ